MNPDHDPIYAGIAGVKMIPAEFELGHGIVLRKTYAHFMAPFMMAFSPPEKGKPHPAPWSAVSGGLAIDMYLQLHIPKDFEQPNFFDRLNTVWWIAALLRLRGAARVHVPVIAGREFHEVPENCRDTKMLPVEVLPRRQASDNAIQELNESDLIWLRDTWLPGGKLMQTSSVFNDALQAFDGVGSMPSPSVAMVAVWGALEHLFSPAKQELRFRVSANIASFLEPPGDSRLVLHRKIMKLYDARSSVAHGTRLKSEDAWTETMALARKTLMKILEMGSVPSKEDMEKNLFSSSL
jgi:hypothetical protein